MFELGSEGRPWRALRLVWDGRSLQRCWEFRDARFISIKTWTESNKCAVNGVAMDNTFAYICMPVNFDDAANGMQCPYCLQTQEGLDLQGMSLHGYLFAALATCEFTTSNKSCFDWFQTLAQLGNFEAIVLSMGHGFPAAVLFINSKHRHAAKQHTYVSYAYSFASFQGFKFKKFGFVVARLGPQIRLALPWQSRYDAGTRWVSGKSWKVINQMRLYRLYTGLGCVVGWKMFGVWKQDLPMETKNKSPQVLLSSRWFQPVSQKTFSKQGEAKELSWPTATVWNCQKPS